VDQWWSRNSDVAMRDYKRSEVEDDEEECEGGKEGKAEIVDVPSSDHTGASHFTRIPASNSLRNTVGGSQVFPDLMRRYSFSGSPQNAAKVEKIQPSHSNNGLNI
jgi:hypothetical protein